jgi:hypothetical protein
VLAVAPFFHVMGFMATLALPLASGATVVTMPRFDLEGFLALIQRHRVTVLVVPPPIMAALARHPMIDGYDLSSLELIVSGGAPLGADLQRAVAARIPSAAVRQGWGLTETSIGVTLPDRRFGTVPGSVGRVMPNTELRVVDPRTGGDLGAGEPGELWARGPQVMAGYLGRPDATVETVDADGWLHTGDLGYVDDDGNVFIVDRLKELIKVSAYQVAPAELEALLAGHPAVADAAVIPRPDATHGEIPVALVVPRGEVDADELIAWVADRVAPHSASARSTSSTPFPGPPLASSCAGSSSTRTARGSERRCVRPSCSATASASNGRSLAEPGQALVALGERRVATAEQRDRRSRRVSGDGHQADVGSDTLDLHEAKPARHVDGRRPWASERGQPAAADQHRRDIADHSINEVLGQERPCESRSSFQEHRADLPFAERCQQRGQVQAAVDPRQPDEVRAAFEVLGVGILGDRNQGGCGVVENPCAHGGAGVGVHDDSQRLATTGCMANGQMRIVDPLGPGTDHDRV